MLCAILSDKFNIVIVITSLIFFKLILHLQSVLHYMLEICLENNKYLFLNRTP